MSWDAVIQHEQDAIDPAMRYVAYRQRNPRAYMYHGVTHRSLWSDAYQDYRNLLLTWEDQDQRTAVLELRKGEASVFWPLFHTDPRVTLDCPKDGPVVVDAEGYCSTCAYDFTR